MAISIVKTSLHAGHFMAIFIVTEHPLAAPLVQEAFTRYAKGETVKAIVDSFNDW